MTDAEIAARAIDRELIAKIVYETIYYPGKFDAHWRKPRNRQAWIDRAQTIINKLLDSSEQPSSAKPFVDG